MRRRAHRSAFALLVAPLAGTEEWKPVLMQWATDATVERRGTRGVLRSLEKAGRGLTFAEGVQVYMRAFYRRAALETLIYKCNPMFSLLNDREPAPVVHIRYDDEQARG